MFDTIEEAREYFSGDRFATENGMTLDELDVDDTGREIAQFVGTGYKLNPPT